ncbi:MAG: S1/P1 nuclease [Blastocatellia bacterium]
MKHEFLRKLLACLTLSLCLISLLPEPAAAWGAKGHRIVAQIAQNHLTPRARRRIARILDNATLASIANRADALVQGRNPSRPETRKWHFVDIPVVTPPGADNTYDSNRDCLPTREGDCVIAEIDRARITLANPRASKAQLAEALLFIVHMTGDLHQPLHSAERDGDRGGGAVDVVFFGQASNLHKVWDSGMIDRAMLQPGRNTEARYVRMLESGLTSGTISASDGGSDVDWSNEAHKIATANAYGKLPNRGRAIGQRYFNDNIVVVNQQLLRAGLRLAKILNDTLD